MPLKVIVIDDTESETITGPLGANGSLDQKRFDWLVSELQEGQDNGKLMIIAAHIPLRVDIPDQSGSLRDPSSTPKLR